MPKLAAFPKAYMDALCIDGTMKLQEWIDLAATLDIQGLEFYSGFLEMQDEKNWVHFRSLVEDHGMTIPMLCCSPDFTHPDLAFRKQQVELEKKWIDMTHALGGSYCRVLSGQKRPELTREEGIQYTVECIQACLPYAQDRGIHLIIENHYKDNYWTYPEFAQMSDVFSEIVHRISHPFFGVNYDPSNTILAGEDPIDLLQKVKTRVITMHASDRYLAHGTIEDLRKQENSIGYASLLRHGEIGQGLNDYDEIFSILKSVGFDGWISIEDGVDGFDQLQRSVSFLKRKISEIWS
ncbi:MAG: TIM barrel protein [Saprospiraceae bacterium]|nr:TIM barrel protein [Saprospiraceae bacterium]